MSLSKWKVSFFAFMGLLNESGRRQGRGKFASVVTVNFLWQPAHIGILML